MRLPVHRRQTLRFKVDTQCVIDQTHHSATTASQSMTDLGAPFATTGCAASTFANGLADSQTG